MARWCPRTHRAIAPLRAARRDHGAQPPGPARHRPLAGAPQTCAPDGGEAVRAPKRWTPEQELLVIGDARMLMTAELVSVGCRVDGRQHLIDENLYAAELLASAAGSVGQPWLTALCGRRLLLDSLLADPRPLCPGCVQLGRPRLLAIQQGRSVGPPGSGCRQRTAEVVVRVVRVGLSRRATDSAVHGHRAGADGDTRGSGAARGGRA